MSRRAIVSNGFTLIELLVVVGIIGILLGLLLPAVRGARAQSEATVCMTHLRTLYQAQMFYADANGGRLASPMVLGADARWDVKLEPFLAKNPGETATTVLSFACPSVPDDGREFPQLTYGINSCVLMPNWSQRRAAKYNASEIILMGDKALGGSDQLISHDRFFLEVNGGGPMWADSANHRPDRSYRHVRGTKANMLMADGHVRPMDANALMRDSGHWYWGDWSDLSVSEYWGPCCE